MKLNDLIKTELDINISDICTNSKKCTKDSIFFCTLGETHDSHNFVNEAILNGAVFIVSSKELDIKIPYIIVNDVESLLQECTKIFFNIESLMIVGVTGTDGKTTTALISKHILSSKYNVGYIGTNGIIYNDKKFDSINTTPSNLELIKYLSIMQSEGVEIVILEVSSHSISLGRINNIFFDVAILTNITREHLDFHKTMKNYINTKALLFKNSKTFSIINKDISQYDYINKICSIDNTYSLDEFENISITINSLSFEYLNQKFSSNIGFKFNLYNILASIKLCAFFNIPINLIKEQLTCIPKIDGRQVIIENILVDFAHTPNAISSVLTNISNMSTKKVITVLGACGNRDKKKRPLMGKIASENSYFLIITDEDPKYEDPSKIRKDLISGIKNYNYMEIPNRADAINYAINISKNNECIVVIFGKGSETTQDFGDIKKEHSDIDCVLDILNNF